MTFVVRFSTNIQNDIERNWSAWMNQRFSSLEALKAESTMYETAYYENDENEEAALETLDIRVDPHTNEYCIVHHNGLSCFALEAETTEEAEEEASEFVSSFNGVWDGQLTRGGIELVKDLGNNWYLLEAEDTGMEM